MKIRFLIPLGLFLLLVVLLGVGLRLDPHEVPSPLIGKPVPRFELPTLHDPATRFSPEQMHGQVWLLNVWASWCASCRAEHRLVNELAGRNEVVLIGLNYKDQRNDALAWLQQLGNPYRTSLSDAQGLVGIDWGVYGVPESFLIDKQGRVRYKQIGPLTHQALNETILPLVRQLKGEM